VDGKDFFLRKGIGWAMRSLAKHRPNVVRGWLKRWAERLSPLSVREAKKGLAR
jgi:3-methyladenine DNA glycosylase AlkD